MNTLLVDDTPLFLEGLANVLRASGINVVGMATNARDALARARELLPDLVLMDIHMPGESGIEATRVLKTEFPTMKIVMMTVSDQDAHLFDAIAAGASGYLLKGEPEGFLEALRGMARGESPLSPGLAERILAEFARREQARKASDSQPLTARQVEILGRIAQGRPYKEIAEELGVSEANIKYHMGEITNRLHVENRAQAIACAARLGLTH